MVARIDLADKDIYCKYNLIEQYFDFSLCWEICTKKNVFSAKAVKEIQFRLIW